MENKYIKSSAQVILLVFCFSLILPFQNCAVYKSEGRKEFESSVKQADDKGCYPYLDTNLVMEFTGVTDGTLQAYISSVSNETGYSCDFYSEDAIFDHINCKIAASNAEQAYLFVDEGYEAFYGAISSWDASVRSGFSGSYHGGYITYDSDGYYTVRFLALDGSETLGAGCSVRLSYTEYATSSTLSAAESAIAQMAYEMAIQNTD